MLPDWQNEGGEETTGVWGRQQKEQWLLNRLFDLAKIKGSNSFEIHLEDVQTPIEHLDDPMNDFPPTLFFVGEQRALLDIFALKNIIELLGEGESNTLSIRLIEKAPSSSSMYSQEGYKTLRDVLLDVSLREELLDIIKRAYGVINEREIRRQRHVKIDIDERWNGSYQDEKILLLEELGIAKADWEKLKTQTHRTVGSRLISVYFDGEKVGDFVDAVIGRKSFINPRALEHVAASVKDLMSGEKWYNFLIEQGVPPTLFPGKPSKKELLYETLLTLCSTGDDRDRKVIENIFSGLVHPLIHGGNEELASRHEWEISKLLKYDGLCLLEGKMKPLDDEAKTKIADIQAAIDDELIDFKTASSMNCSLEELEALGASRRSYVGKTSQPLTKTHPNKSEPKAPEKESDEMIYAKSLSVSSLFFQAKIAVTQLQRILSTACVQPIYIPDDAMNHVYTVYHHYLEILFIRSELEGLRQEFAQLPESLLTDFEDYDVAWEHGYSKSLSRIKAKVEQFLILNPIEDPKSIHVPTHLESLGEHTNTVLLEYSNLVKNHFDKMLQSAEKRAKEITPVNPPKVQEKPELPKVEVIVYNTNSQTIQASEPSNEKGSSPKFPHKLPAGTRWEDITIKFLDEESILILVNKFKIKTNYQEMGFTGKGKNPNPSEAWAFLKVLARLNGELAIKDAEARDKYKKQKELLAKSFQSYFSLDYDPFFPYKSSPEKEGNSYKVKVTLIPLPSSPQDVVRDEDEDSLGIQESLDEFAPQTYTDDE